MIRDVLVAEHEAGATGQAHEQRSHGPLEDHRDRLELAALRGLVERAAVVQVLVELGLLGGADRERGGPAHRPNRLR